MGAVTTREELKEYCLRRLGYPVIEINVADEELEDRIDDAIQYFNEWHFEGATRMYLKHKLTASTLNLANTIASDKFVRGNLITGTTSGTTSTVWSHTSNNLSLQIYKTKGDGFVAGEHITTSDGGTGIISSATGFYVAGDCDNHSIPMDNAVISISKIFPISSTAMSSSYLFDASYYYAFDTIYNFGSLDLLSYEMMKERINMINMMFSGEKPVEYQRYQGKLMIYMDWDKMAQPDGYLMVDGYRLLDPATYPAVYNDFFLKAYCTALIKIQWGGNLSKFSAIQLPGGVTLDGPRILEEGKAEKTELEEQMKNGRWSSPLGFMVG